MDREGERFRARFSAAVRDVEDALGRVEQDVSRLDGVLEQMQQAVGSAADDASAGATAAEEAQWAIDHLPGEDYFDGKFAELAESLRYTPDGAVWVALQRARRDGWEMVRQTVANNPGDEKALEAVQVFRSLPDPIPGAHGQNLEELRGWQSLGVLMVLPGGETGERLLSLAQELRERRARAVHPTRMADLPPIDEN
jgi:hypothetical protein